LFFRFRRTESILLPAFRDLVLIQKNKPYLKSEAMSYYFWDKSSWLTADFIS